MRSIYLDEAGISRFSEEPVLSVAGIILHADTQWRALNEYFTQIVREFVPADCRPGFVFHTHQVWHGSGIFDPKKYSLDRRDFLHAVADAVPKFQLPIVWGIVQREKAKAILALEQTVSEQSILNTAFMCAFADCANRADVWMKQYGESECSSIVMENNNDLRRYAKGAFQYMKSGALEEALKNETDLAFPLEHLRLTRIIDAPSFMEKTDAPPLQLADFCAYMIKRYFADKGDVTDYMAKLMGSMMYGFHQEKLKQVLAQLPKDFDASSVAGSSGPAQRR